MDFTRLAVLLATSLADWTNCLLATGLDVLEEARRHALHSADVCLATMVAAESTYGREARGSGRRWKQPGHVSITPQESEQWRHFDNKTHLCGY